jgi:nicotinate phosphoribosyltransferase
MSDRRDQPGPQTLSLSDGDLALATDLYQLTMAAAYWARQAAEAGEPPRASFELSVRRLPAHRNFLVFAGLEQALASLAALRFDREQVAYLRGLEPFRDVPAGFFDALARFRFRGDVRALPEGTLFFPGEPVLSVTGDLIEAQLVETLLLSIVNFQVVIASKAARVRLAAGEGASLAEFGGRRAHGPQAAAWVARAAYLAGFDSTSNVFAGYRLGIPLMGTMAHSFVMSFADEIDAFRHYQSVFPEHAIHLVDTYDTLEGTRKALATERPFVGVRLDSGDLGELARQVRGILDRGGRPDAKIFASGDLDEGKIAALRAAGAPIDAFGVGTELATSADAPALSGIYKLVEVRRGGRRLPTFKASFGKATYPGIKQVLRGTDGDGTMRGDRVVLAGEDGAAAGGLLVPVMRAGEPLPGHSGLGDLGEARRRCLDGLAALPPALRALEVAAEPYPVVVGDDVEALLAAARAREAAAAGDAVHSLAH